MGVRHSPLWRSTLIAMSEISGPSIVEVLAPPKRTALERLGVPVRYPAKATVFREGQPSRAVLIIQAGHVKVTHRAEDGADVLLAVRGPGEVMGDEGVLMQEPRSATVTAISEVSGLDVSAGDLLSFVNAEGLWPEMYRAVVWRRREADERAMAARLGVRSRLIRLLLELGADVGEEDGEEIKIGVALSQQDLAGRIGASRDAVAIELRRLREQGLVRTGRSLLVLEDVDKLREAL